MLNKPQRYSSRFHLQGLDNIRPPAVLGPAPHPPPPRLQSNCSKMSYHRPPLHTAVQYGRWWRKVRPPRYGPGTVEVVQYRYHTVVAGQRNEGREPRGVCRGMDASPSESSNRESEREVVVPLL